MLQVEVYNSSSPLENTLPVLSLIQKQMGSVGSPKTPEHINKALSGVFRPGSRAALFLAYHNDIPIAFAFGNIGAGLESGGDYFWLNELYVDAPYRRRGCAGKLLSYIEGWLKSNGIKYIAGVTGKDNTGAQCVYKKSGYDTGDVVWFDKSI